MPFHSHHQQGSGSNAPQGAAAGIYQAAQTLGSIGAPTGNLRIGTQGTTAAGTDALLPGSGNAPGLGVHGGGQTAPPTASGLPGPSASASTTPQQPFETPRRGAALGRTGEELHISAVADNMGQHVSSSQSHLQQTPQQAQQQMYNSPQQYSAGSAPNITLQQATPSGSQYTGSSAAGGGVPGSLQPGSATRPGPTSSYTAPNTVPTIPQGNQSTQQQYTLPTRSNTMNTSHNYSRSSPAGLEQKYVPFSNTPENAKYGAAPSQKYYNPQTPIGASHSPLALADIRPRGNSTADDTMTGGALIPDYDKTPSNSNYLAPWATYAFDWCKWPVHGGNSAGKMAVGSYLEDAHNFVCPSLRHISQVSSR